MKLVTAMVRPFIVEKVNEALHSLGIEGLTATEVKGFGRQRGHTEVYRGAEYIVNFIPKVKIDVVVTDENAARVIEAISDVARTGKIGDGKVLVQNIVQAVRIRTGELNEMAL